jgi:DNA-directed RNA polymerase specialized sigma24 family protein
LADKGSSGPLPPVAPFLGSDRLGGRLPDAEKKRLDKLLRDHGFHAARRRAVLFGRRLARGLAGAEDLAQRACLRLVRLGWDPNEVTLEKRLCRLVWSEWTNEKSEDARRRKGEAGFLAEMAVHEGTSSRSPEDYAVRLEEERAEEQHAVSQVERLRQALIAEKDNVNLYWLQCTLEGKTDLAQMARESARDVNEFYAAAKRRNRIVARLVAEDRGVTHDPGEKPR